MMSMVMVPVVMMSMVVMSMAFLDNYCRARVRVVVMVVSPMMRSVFYDDRPVVVATLVLIALVPLFAHSPHVYFC